MTNLLDVVSDLSAKIYDLNTQVAQAEELMRDIRTRHVQSLVAALDGATMLHQDLGEVHVTSVTNKGNTIIIRIAEVDGLEFYPFIPGLYDDEWYMEFMFITIRSRMLTLPEGFEVKYES